jgi:hypothetical protein
MNAPGRRSRPTEEAAPQNTSTATQAAVDDCRRIARAAQRPRRYLEVNECCPGQYPPLEHTSECCGE